MSTDVQPPPDREPSLARSGHALPATPRVSPAPSPRRTCCEPGTARGLFRRLSNVWHADFLSPKDLVRRAIVIAVLYAVASLAGLREFTSVLCNTIGAVELGFRVSAFLGIGYVVLHLAFVLVFPILLIAALLLRFLSSSSSSSKH